MVFSNLLKPLTKHSIFGRNDIVCVVLDFFSIYRNFEKRSTPFVSIERSKKSVVAHLQCVETPSFTSSYAMIIKSIVSINSLTAFFDTDKCHTWTRDRTLRLVCMRMQAKLMQFFFFFISLLFERYRRNTPHTAPS